MPTSSYPSDSRGLTVLHAFTLLLALATLPLAAGCGPAEPAEEIDPAEREWRTYGGSPAFTRYSPLDHINRENVDRLEVAWTYETGDDGYTNECQPIVVDGVLYGTTPTVSAFALDAATGEELWTFDPYAHTEMDRITGSWGVNRGVAYWAGESGENPDPARIFLTLGPNLYAINARTGDLIETFGEGGIADLESGLDRDLGETRVGATTPGLVYEDVLILGSKVDEGPGPVAPGHVRAFDVRTGERRWIFHTIPHPGETGYETWPKDAWTRSGGANAWGGFSLDEERGIVYFGTGSPAYDHYGGDRHGENLFANSVVALEAATGQRIWHFQTVHHDLWDYDLPSPPNLVTVEHGGERIDAAAQVTKMGYLFLFDRVTGEPLFEIEERPVAQTDLPGEQTAPTQPVPVRPPSYARQGFREEDITDRTQEAHEYVRSRVFERFGEAEIFDPPSLEGGVVHPQFNGGTDWGGAAFDPATGTLYLNTSNEPELLTMVPAAENAEHPHPYVATGHQPVKDDEGYPINTPPWGTLSAIDLNVGEILWQVPFGTYKHLGAPERPQTGTFNMGGPAVTAGGLVFLGASMDEKFRAFDAETGRILWETTLPAGGYANPAVYEAAGRQFVVIAAGGGGRPGTPTGDSYVAFALPES